MKRVKNWVKLLIFLILIVIIFANPFSRSIVHFILPLGSGVDDLIEIAALIATISLLIYKGKSNWNKIVNWFRDDDYDF